MQGGFSSIRNGFRSMNRVRMHQSPLFPRGSKTPNELSYAVRLDSLPQNCSLSSSEAP